jgi:hypothetical protein
MAKTKYFTLIYYAEFVQYVGWAVILYGLALKFKIIGVWWMPFVNLVDKDGWWLLAYFVILGIHMVVVGQLISNFIDIEVNTRSRRERYQRDDPY